MTIIQNGSTNLTALIVPGLYVNIISPQVAFLNGVPTNGLGVVGCSSWGPVNQPVQVATYAQYVKTFGPLQNATYDMGTQISTAILQGANNFWCVRVSDGTDTAAQIEVLTNCILFKSLYTGAYGNNCVVSIAAGSTANTSKVIVSMPAGMTEVFDNISGTGNTLWLNMASAINGGQNSFRGPSQLITGTAGVGTTAPTLTSYTLTGGTNGTTTITSAVLMGANTSPPTGIYALQGKGVSLGIVADLTDQTQWSTLESFGLSNGILWVVTDTAGSSISSSQTALTTSGAASTPIWFLHGDYAYWNDPINQVSRWVSPVGFAAGLAANLSPEQSPLNKPIYGISDTQRTSSGAATASYAYAELQTLFSSGIDVISLPSPGGNYFSCLLGHNTSPNPANNGINYTRMTNYIASTLNAGMGVYIGRVINAQLFANITSTLNNFFANMLGQKMLTRNADGSLPYSVVCNSTNNPNTQTQLGIVQADVNVTLMGINEKFIINLTDGVGVTITKISSNNAS